MAYGVKYRLKYKDALEELHTLEILPENYGGSVTDISEDGFASPVRIIPVEKEKLSPVRGTGLVMSFYQDGRSYTDLFTEDPKGVKVKLYDKDSNLQFSGYLNTEDYDEDYNDLDGLIEFSANDGLNMIKNYDFFENTSKPWSKGFDLFSEIILACLDSVEFSEYVFISDLMEENYTAVTDFFDEEGDYSDYINEDGESMNMRKVLEAVMAQKGFTLAIAADTCFIYQESLLVNSPVNAIRLDRNFNVLGNTTIDNKLDFSDNDFEFDGPIRQGVVRGINEMKINYNPFPDVRKVIPGNPKDMAIDDTSPWFYYEQKDASGTRLQWFWLRGFLNNDHNNADDFDVTFNNKASLTEYLTLDYGSSINQPSKNSGKKHFVIRDSCYDDSNPTNTSPEEDAIVIDAGYIAKTDDSITIKFKVLTEDINAFAKATRIIQIPLRIRIGTGLHWAEIIGNRASNWTSMKWNQFVTVVLTEGNAFRQEVEFSVELTNIPVSDRLKIYFGRETIMQNSLGVVQPFGVNFYTLISDFEVLVNNEKIDTTDVLETEKTSSRYNDDKDLELIHGSEKLEGASILDRGITLFNGVPANNYYFNSEGSSSYYTILDLLFRMYLAEFGSPCRQLTGRITSANMYKKNAGTYNKCLLPITVIKHTSRQGSRQFLNLGGDFDTQTLEYSGKFQELKGL